MATVRVIDIIGRVEEVLQDQDATRWSRLQKQDWLNECYDAIVALRPDANSQVGTLTCTAGVRQDITNIDAEAVRVLDVVRNLAVSSNKGAVRLKTRAELDDLDPLWYSLTGTVDIEFFAFDPKLPKQILTYPPALITAQLEVIYQAAVSPKHALTEPQLDPAGSQADVILLNDMYSPAIVDYVLHRCYSKDSTSNPAQAKAAQYLDSFITKLNAKTETDAVSAPGDQ